MNMTEQIKDPYVAAFSKFSKSWNVTYRFLIKDKINFTHVCSCPNNPTARKIATLLNKDLAARQDVSCVS